MAPTTADKLDALAVHLSSVATAIRAGTTDLSAEKRQRMALAQAGTDLIHAVLTPEDRVNMVHLQFSHVTAIRLFIQWKAFEAIPMDEKSTISYVDLAAVLGGDVSLITRVGRILVANDTLQQIGSDQVAHTAFSKILTHPGFRAMMEIIFDSNLASLVALPSYFEHFGLIEPQDRRQTPLAFAEGQLGRTAWEIYHRDEARLRRFMLAMDACQTRLPSVDNYNLGWVAERARETASEPGRILFVDVGGGRGHVLKRVLDALPELSPRRFALEDLPEVIEKTRQERPDLAEVQLVAMDFHKEQPIKGALVYHLSRCLHDYSDNESVAILHHIANAMAPDSRLLIVELVVGNPPSAYHASLDLMMMVVSGKERTRENWEDIAARAGLRVVRVIDSDAGTSVIECVLA